MAFVVSSGALLAIERAAPPMSYTMRIAENHYRDYPALWRAQPELRTVIDFLARNIAQLGLHVFRRVSDVDRVRLTDHPLAGLLDKPNGSTTTYRLINALVHDMCIFDSGYWLKVRDGANTLGLRRIRPQRITPDSDDWIESSGYEIIGSRGRIHVDADQVVHFRGYNPDDDRLGAPPIESLRHLLAEEWAANTYREQLWRNGARIAGYIQRPTDAPEWGDKGREKFKTMWHAEHTGDSEKAGGVPMLEDGMTFVSAATSPRDAQYIECVVGETLITLADGTRRRADEMVSGDRVVSWAEGLMTAEVEAIHKTVPVDTVTVTDQTGRSLRTSRNHPYLAVRGPHKTPGGRTLGTLDDRAEWVAASDLGPGDYVRVALGPDVASTGEVDPETAWAVGALVGNGHLRADHSIGFSSVENSVCERFGAWCESVGASLVHHPRRKDCTWINGSRHVREILEPMGLLGTHSWDKFVPGQIMRSGPKAWAAFLAGYLDTDGTVTHINAPQPMVTWGSVSRDLLDDAQHLLTLLGIDGVVRPVTPARTAVVNGRTCEARPFFALTVNGHAQVHALAAALNPAHEGKAAKLLQWAAEMPRSNGSRSDKRWSRVTTVEPGGVEHTYAVTIAGTHTHVTAGFVTHNSRKLTREEVARSYHVPLPMVGILDHATFSNIVEQHKQLYQDCLGPWLEMMQQEIELQLLPDLPDRDRVYVEFNINEKLRGSFEEQAAQLQAGVGGPYMTRNEARARLNLPQVDGGDELIVPLNVIAGMTETLPAPAPAEPAPKALSAALSALLAE